MGRPMAHVRRSLGAGLLATLALAVAGCGAAKTGAGVPSGASLVRSDALAFVSVDSDLGSSQWRQVDDLSHKFPGRSKALAQINQALAKEGVEYERDIKPALGPELDLAVVMGATAEKTSVVGLTKPDDAAKFKALIAKLNKSDPSEPAVYKEVDGWYAISDSQAAIDRVLKKPDGSALADDGTYKDALDKLPGDVLATAYLSGPELKAGVAKAVQESGSTFDLSSVGLDKVEFIAASASAESDGLRAYGVAKGVSFGNEFTSKLIGGIPGDALALLDFRGEDTTDQLKALESDPMVAPSLVQLEAMLGVSFDEILVLLHNEVAFYVRPGALIPELTLALETPDQSSALKTLDKLAARLAATAGVRVQPGSQGGHPVKTINLGQFAIHYGSLDGKVLVTSGLNGIADYGGSGERLPESADFKEAQDAAGMPDSHGGFFYVDLKDSIPLIEGLVGLASTTPPSDVTENLRPLRSFLAWVEASGDLRTFDAFLEIK